MLKSTTAIDLILKKLTAAFVAHTSIPKLLQNDINHE